MSVAIGSLVPAVLRPASGLGHSSALVVGGPLHGKRLSLCEAVPAGPYLDYFAAMPWPAVSCPVSGAVPYWYRLCDFEAVELSGIRWWVLVPRWVAQSRRRCGAFAPAVRAVVSSVASGMGRA